MRRPTLPLIATAAVAGAIAVAVPALASSGSGPAAHSARARHCSAVIVISHHRRVRACLIRGPRGFTGFPGPKGATGKTGPAGKNGKNGSNGKNGTNGTNGTNGAAGAPGTARAYAVVKPSAEVIVAQSSNITSVSEPTPGTYCVIPAVGINPSSYPPVVSQEISYSTAGPGVVAVNAQHPDCPTGFEVDTYAATSATPTTTATGYAFTIVIP